MSAHRLCHQNHEVAPQREPAVRREYQLLPSFGVAHAAEAAVFGLRRPMWSQLGGQPFAIPFSCSLQKRSFPFPLLQHINRSEDAAERTSFYFKDPVRPQAEE